MLLACYSTAGAVSCYSSSCMQLNCPKISDYPVSIYDAWHALAWSCVRICSDLFLGDRRFERQPLEICTRLLCFFYRKSMVCPPRPRFCCLHYQNHIIRALLLYMPKLNSCYLHVCIVTTSCQYSYDIHTLTGVCESASYHVTTAAGFVISTANTWSVDPERVPVVYISHIRRVLFLYICLLSLGCVCSYYPSSWGVDIASLYTAAAVLLHNCWWCSCCA